MAPADWLKQRGKIYRRWLNSIRVEQRELARHGIISTELADLAATVERLIHQTDARRAATCPPHTTI